MRRSALLMLAVLGAAAGCAGQAAQAEPTLPEASGEEAEAADVEAAPAVAEPELPPCSPSEDDVAPGEMATVPQSDRVWAAVRHYLLDNPGDLAGTYDIPGEAHGMATLESFRAVQRTEGGFVTLAEFRDGDHTFEVTFDLRGQCELVVTGATLQGVDGEPTGEAPAVTSAL